MCVRAFGSGVLRPSELACADAGVAFLVGCAAFFGDSAAFFVRRARSGSRSSWGASSLGSAAVVACRSRAGTSSARAWLRSRSVGSKAWVAGACDPCAGWRPDSEPWDFDGSVPADTRASQPPAAPARTAHRTAMVSVVARRALGSGGGAERSAEGSSSSSPKGSCKGGYGIASSVGSSCLEASDGCRFGWIVTDENRKTDPLPLPVSAAWAEGAFACPSLRSPSLASRPLRMW